MQEGDEIVCHHIFPTVALKKCLQHQKCIKCKKSIPIEIITLEKIDATAPRKEPPASWSEES